MSAPHGALIAPPPGWTTDPQRISPSVAARLLGVDLADLDARQDVRAHHVEAHGRAWSSDIPAVDEAGDYRRLDLLVWAARLGLYPKKVGGHQVIGYAGIAERLGYRGGQYVRKLAMQAEAQPDGIGLPAPVVVINLSPRQVVLRDWPEVKRWAIHTSRLDPDGVTPLVKRPRRGPRQQ